MKKQFSGVGVAVVTPFKNGKIDFNSLEQIINHLIEGNVNYIVSLGTTGESVTLTTEEKKEIVQHTVRVVNERVPVMVGCGGNYTSAVMENMIAMEQWADFDAFLSVSPSYSKPSQEGIYQHFKAVAASTDKDIILYNVPGRTAKNMAVETILRLAQDCPNITGIKEAGGNMQQSTELAIHKPNDFTLISGDDDLLLAQMALGFDGVISVAANAFPQQWTDIVKTIQVNRVQKAQEIFHRFYEFIQLIFEENNPGGIKCALNEMGLCENEFRLPVVPVHRDLEERIRAFVRKN